MNKRIKQIFLSIRVNKKEEFPGNICSIFYTFIYILIYTAASSNKYVDL